MLDFRFRCFTNKHELVWIKFLEHFIQSDNLEVFPYYEIYLVTYYNTKIFTFYLVKQIKALNNDTKKAVLNHDAHKVVKKVYCSV